MLLFLLKAYSIRVNMILLKHYVLLFLANIEGIANKTVTKIENYTRMLWNLFIGAMSAKV